MRDLLDKIDLLLESTGLANRKPGDVFKNKDNEIITFKSIDFYPREGGKYEEQELNDLIVQLGTDVKWQNTKPKTGGVALATFDSKDGELKFGFFRKEIKPFKTDNKNIPNEVDGFSFAGKAAEKVKSGLTPQDLLTKRDNLTSEDIINQLSEKLGQDNILVKVAQQIAGGSELPIKFPAPEGVSFTAFRDYFCEILQPMALQTGQYKGNAGEAAERFMNGSFSDSLISFDAAKNAGLSDSILSKDDGKYIKVSTKGGAGATASVKNIVNALSELEQGPNGAELLKKYKDTIDIIQEISKQGQVLAPLYLGQKYDIISAEDAETIKKLKNMPPINLENIDQMNISQNLKKLAKERETDDPENVNLFYHLIASVAHLSASEVNNRTDFSKAAADILNNGALIQVYTNMKQGDKEWEIKSFDTFYPGTSVKNVYLSAGKTYYSTDIKGNFTFKIDRTGKKEPEEDNKEETPVVSEPVNTQTQFAKTAAALTKGTDRVLRTISKEKNKKDIGRSKRK